ncbi:unnamed protein product [Diabrotica balteata]|uniref:Uncharacterized protein n=1 Tax=Diabrotica balteata TaxID=107213 RepID=A0A9N9SR63_DIABA|nr:unnamed protein product [Diabrotica balteata]
MFVESQYTRDESTRHYMPSNCTAKKLWKQYNQSVNDNLQDLHGVNLEEFKYGGTNITAFRLVDPDGPEVHKILRDWNAGIDIKNRKGEPPPLYRAETALMYDAVHLFAKALHDLDTSQQIDIKPLSCDAVDFWPHGYSLINYMKVSAPYVMLKETSEKLSGNAQFEGYAVDLIHEISRVLGFNYTIRLVPDGRHGSLNRETKEWDGLIRELLDQKADLAIADLTITYDRFTPYEWQNPHPCNPNPDHLENQFTLFNCMWFAIGSLMQQGCDFLPKFSPYEWDNPHPCDSVPVVLENQFTLLNSLWFTVGTLMQQGSDIAPKAVSTRMVAGMWWFFTLIMISSYTANLAAFLTVERMDSPIETAEDLAKQTKIKYGALRGGSTAAFFRPSYYITYLTIA